MEHIFSEITLIIVIAAGLTILFRYFKQPSVLAYIFTGVILGPLGLFHLENHDALQSLGQLGITLLLFMLGLELRLRDLKSIGKTAGIAGTLQMTVTFLLGVLLSVMLGLSIQTAIYIGIGLAFSSTIIIVKLLSDKKDLNSLHGKLALGVLLIQDFFAVLTIIFLTGVTSADSWQLVIQVLHVLLKVVVLFGWIAVLSEFVFPKIMPFLSKSSETLFLFSLAWVFALTALVTSEPIGFSIEIGGFLAGLALATTAENYQIVARMKALRDFFITIFFVMLGIEMTFANLSSVLLPALLFSLFVILVKPILVMFIFGLLGFRKRTSFFVGTSLGQISEFSLIILFLGSQKGVIDSSVVTMMVLIAMITFVVSSYLIQNTNKLYKHFGKYLSFIAVKKKGHAHELSGEGEFDAFENHVILIGGDQMGRSIMHALKQTKEQVLVIDFNPDIIRKLKNEKIPVLFGDIADTEIQERVGFDRAKYVISTVPDLEDNLLLIEGLRHQNKKAKTVVMAYEGSDAKQLYDAGADYVILPHLAGGHHIAKILISDDHLEMIEEYKKKDLSYFS